MQRKRLLVLVLLLLLSPPVAEVAESPWDQLRAPAATDVSLMAVAQATGTAESTSSLFCLSRLKPSQPIVAAAVWCACVPAASVSRRRMFMFLARQHWQKRKRNWWEHTANEPATKTILPTSRLVIVDVSLTWADSMAISLAASALASAWVCNCLL